MTQLRSLGAFCHEDHVTYLQNSVVKVKKISTVNRLTVKASVQARSTKAFLQSEHH